MVRIPINKEIKEYKETMLWGLTLRQTIFAALAILVGGFAGVKLSPYLDEALISWVCILAAAPFGLLGFFKYNGMPAEKFLAAWIRAIKMPPVLLYTPTNIWMEICADSIEAATKEEIPYYD